MDDIKKIKENNKWNILIYFILYSVIGFLLETIYAIFTKGMLESRKSFLYGPFCSIYGIAAVIMIKALNNEKKNIFKVFFLGTLIGLFIEYSFSYFGELIFHIRWWDYSNCFGNINGRICLFYAVIWGILSLVLVYLICPITEKMFNTLLNSKNYILVKFIKIFVIIIMIFLIINSIITTLALKNFIYNICMYYDIQILGYDIENIKIKTEESLIRKSISKYISNYFTNEKMIMNYPNISVTTKEGNVLYLGTILKDYKNYYYNFNLLSKK